MSCELKGQVHFVNSSTHSENSSIAYLDSGANKHLVRPEVHLNNLRLSKLQIMSSNGCTEPVDRAGDLLLRMYDENGIEVSPLVLREVNVSKKTPLNLLSIGLLSEQGIKFHFEKGNNFFIYNNSKFPMMEKNGLFAIDLNNLVQVSGKSSSSDHPISWDGKAFACAATFDVWHRRMGHVAVDRIKFLYKNGMAEGLSINGGLKHDAKCKCVTCLQTNNAKMHIGEVRSFDNGASKRGEIVTADICGPFSPSLHGYQWVIVFIDEYSRFSAVYFLRFKSESEAALVKFIAFARRELFLIKEIRTDQGGEFGGHHERISLEGGSGASELIAVFTRVCNENGIKHVLMPAHRPELHGIVERLNRTLIKMANAMLFDARLSPVLWPEAVAYANFLRNRLPTRGLGKFTPFEVFFGKRPRLSDLKIFGSPCYKLIHGLRKGILGQMKRVKLIFVGFSHDRIGFLCFNPVTFQFTVEFELIFDEEAIEERKLRFRCHDHKTDLIRAGKLDQLPIVYHDSDFVDQETLRKERSLFTSPPIASDQRSPDRSRGVGGDELNVDMSNCDEVEVASQAQTSVNREHHSSASESQTNPADAERHDDMSRTTSAHKCSAPMSSQSPICSDQSMSKSVSNQFHNESISKVQPDSDFNDESHSQPDFGGADNKEVKLSDSLQASENGYIGEFEPDTEASMGDPLASKVNDEQLHRELTPSKIVTELRDVTIDGIRIQDQISRSSRSSRVKSDASTENDQISHVGYWKRLEDDIEVNEEAEKFGPLSDQSVQLEKQKLASKAQQVQRPLRVEPVGHQTKKNSQIMAFAKYAKRHNLQLRFVKNPKRNGTASWHRYNKYQHAQTPSEFLELSATSTDPKIRKKQIATAWQDFLYDLRHGFIVFPDHENTSATHFVNAAIIKQKFSTSSDPSLMAFQTLLESLWDAEAEALSDHVQSDLYAQVAFSAQAIIKSDGAIPVPVHYHQAVHPSNPLSAKWKESIMKERSNLDDHHTLEQTKLKNLKSTDKLISTRYVFAVRKKKSGEIELKSRLVAQGFTQERGVNFHSDEVYVSLCSVPTFRLLMSYACGKGMVLGQSDISGAYLEATLKEAIYVKPPPDMLVNGKLPKDEDGDEFVYRLRKGLYGLVQSGYAWAECFKAFMLSQNFKEFTGEPNLYRLHFELGDQLVEIIVGIYVDDCLIAATSINAFDWFITKLKGRFPVNPKSSGLITVNEPGFVLSMQVYYDINAGILEFNQIDAIETLAQKFKIVEQTPKRIPMSEKSELTKLEVATFDITQYLSVVGSLMHISQVSRPDIAKSVGELAKHASTPGPDHYEAAIQVVNYLFNSRDLCIQYKRGNDPNRINVYSGVFRPKSIEERLVASQPENHPNQVQIFIDADHGGDKFTRRSTTGMVSIMNFGPFHWASRLQKLCATSTAEAEIYAVTECTKEVIHIRLICIELGLLDKNTPVTIWEDNNACIHMAHGLRGAKGAKHFETRLRFLHEHVRDKTIEFARINTDKQLADGFTKLLGRTKFEEFRSLMLKKPEISRTE